MVEAHLLHVVVCSNHPSAEEQVAEAIGRVLSRYAVDLGLGVEVPVPHKGVEVTYIARRPMSLASIVRQARTASGASSDPRQPLLYDLTADQGTAALAEAASCPMAAAQRRTA